MRPLEERVAAMQKQMQWHLRQAERPDTDEASVNYHLSKAAFWENRAVLTSSGAIKVGRSKDASLQSRNKEVADARNAGESLRDLAARYGVSFERIRQIVRAYDRKHGTEIGRTARAISHAKQRVDTEARVCPFDGTVFHAKPSSLKKYCCQRCVSLALGTRRRRFSDAVVGEFVALRDQGVCWTEIARRYDTTMQGVQRAIYSLLARENALTPENVASIFLVKSQSANNGVTYRGRSYRWMRRLGLPSSDGTPVKTGG